MIEYYKEQMNIATAIGKFAEVGFFKEVEAIAKTLMNAKTKKEVDMVYDALGIAIEALNETQDDVERAVINYEEAVKRSEDKA